MDDKPIATETTKTDHKTDINASLMTFITFISSFLNVTLYAKTLCTSAIYTGTVAVLFPTVDIWSVTYWNVFFNAQVYIIDEDTNQHIAQLDGHDATRGHLTDWDWKFTAAISPTSMGGPRSTSEPAESSSNDQTFQIDREYEEWQFVHRIDNLMTALANFSSSYKTGHVIDVKKVKQVRKALHEIEKSEWFKLEKTE